MACPICRNPNQVDFHEKAGQQLVICPGCRHITWRLMPTPDELRTHYATSYSLKDAQQHIQSENRKYYRQHLGELLGFIGPDAASRAIVDFGCSYPVLLEEAKALGFARAIGVESDEAACRYGRDRGIEMCSVDEFRARVQPQSVDVIRFSHVLEHLIDPLGTLTMAASKVRPGGVVHITQPGFPVLAAEASVHDLKDSVWPEHLQFFSPISLKVMLDAARIAPLSFYTHTNADDVVSKYARQLDLAEAAEALRALRNCGRAWAGRSANYPAYAGEDSVVFGRVE